MAINPLKMVYRRKKTVAAGYGHQKRIAQGLFHNFVNYAWLGNVIERPGKRDDAIQGVYSNTFLITSGLLNLAFMLETGVNTAAWSTAMFLCHPRKFSAFCEET